MELGESFNRLKLCGSNDGDQGFVCWASFACPVLGCCDWLGFESNVDLWISSFNRLKLFVGVFLFAVGSVSSGRGVG